MPNSLMLGSVLDLKAAAPLKASLLEHRGEDVRIDASSVNRLGGLCLQLLLAAQKAWAEDGLAFAIQPRSDAFTDSVRLFGAAARLDAATPYGDAL